MFAVNNWIYQNRQIVQVTTHHFKVNSKCVVNLLYKDKQCKKRKAQRKVILSLMLFVLFFGWLLGSHYLHLKMSSVLLFYHHQGQASMLM